MGDQQSVNGWTNAEQRYHSGQEVHGIVTRVAQFGVFVQVEPGIEGIVYTFELGHGPSAIAGLTPGQELQLYVKNIDTSRKRLELSLSNQPTPGLFNERLLPPELRQKKRLGEPDGPLSDLPFDKAVEITSAHTPGCPNCQRPVQTAWKFCVYCGGSLQRHCPACGSVQPALAGARYCYECGKPL